MAGAYCRYCNRRCFNYRIVPAGPYKGWAGHMASCPQGKEHDRSVLGYDHDTAINPILATQVTVSVRNPATGCWEVTDLEQCETITDRNPYLAEVDAEGVGCAPGTPCLIEWLDDNDNVLITMEVEAR